MNPMILSYRASTTADDPQLRALLTTCELPVDDVATGRQDYLLAHEGSSLVGSVGLELIGEDALLRSLAVTPAWRGRGVADTLCERVVELATRRGIKSLFLLTTTAADFFSRRGFERIERALVPPEVLSLPQFRSLCPASAVCLRRKLA